MTTTTTQVIGLGLIVIGSGGLLWQWVRERYVFVPYPWVKKVATELGKICLQTLIQSIVLFVLRKIVSSTTNLRIDYE